jgi:hypothetical protein
MTDFDKQHYWQGRALSADEKRFVKDLERKQLVVAVHSTPDWQKVRGTKSLAAKKRAALRRMIRDASAQLFMILNPTPTHPQPKHCYYCQETKIHKDGVCKGHWHFMFANMTNHQRMIEKAYHRNMRAEERKAHAKQLKAQGVPA